MCFVVNCPFVNDVQASHNLITIAFYPPLVYSQQVDGVSAAIFAAHEEAFVAVFTVAIALSASVSVNYVKDLICMVTLSSSSASGGSGVGSGGSGGSDIVGEQGSADSEVIGGNVDCSDNVLDVQRHLDTPTATTTTTTTTSTTSTSTSTTTATNLPTNSKTTFSDYIVIRYRIDVPGSSGVTYSQLSAQLTSSVQNDVFTSLLQQHAAEQNVPELSSASSSRVDTEEITPNSEESSKSTIMTVPVIVGIAIGGCAVLVVVIYLFLKLFFRRAPNQDGLPQLDTVQHQGMKSCFIAVSFCCVL